MAIYETLHLSTAMLALTLLSACQSLPEDPPTTVQSVNLEQYTGLWYELARIPVFFQDEEDLATAEYEVREDGTLALTNTAIKPDGTTDTVGGTVVPVEGSNNAKLKVSIDNFFAKIFGSPPSYGNYWILKLASDYSLSLVGSPDRQTLWLLSRKPEISPATLEDYLKHARSLGFETEAMILNNGSFTETPR